MNRLWIGIFSLAAVLAAQSQSGTGLRFSDVTREWGVAFVHTSGATGKKYLPETLGPGVAILDYDNDGWMDLLFTNGQPWSGPRVSTPRLFRNNGNRTFSDRTVAAGLAASMQGMGVAAGDIDNDGDEDVLLTAVGQNMLFRNEGNGRFSDQTRSAGLSGIDEFSSSAAFLDYDKDGWLDIFVGNYVQWTPETDIVCRLDGRNKSYCTPEAYKGVSPRLWKGVGGGRFQDRTREAGLLDPTAKTLGVTVLDVNRDGWLDIAAANDTQPNKLYINNGKGGFAERGVSAGIGFSEDGVARAGMGIDAADYDRSGNASILISNFSNQMIALYHNEGNGLFVDAAPRSDIGRRSLLTLGFAAFFFDADLDGWLDVFVANGHIEADIERVQNRITFAQAPHLFRNEQGRFRETTATAGPALAVRRVARGAAYGDLDNDSDLDLIMTTNGGPAVVLRNDSPPKSALRLRLIGQRSNRSGFGAVARVRSGGAWQEQMLRSGSSYLSQSERVLTFGLGSAAAADEVEVRWPSGQVDRLGRVPSGSALVEEGKGILPAAVPSGARR